MKFIKEIPQFNQAKKIFAYKLIGENGVEMNFILKLQGDVNYNGKKFRKIVYFISFSEVLSCTSKSKDVFVDEGHLVEKALSAIKDKNFEKLYYCFLTIFYNRTIERIKSYEKAKKENRFLGISNKYLTRILQKQ